MSELDVIPLQQAKDFLVVDYTDNDVLITNCIKAAIGWVERYTNYYLWQRTKTFVAPDDEVRVYDYPVTIVSIQDPLGNTIFPLTPPVTPPTIPIYKSQSILICVPSQSTINLTIGYLDITQIPQPLIAACYKLITYLYENKDIYVDIDPADIQMLINQFRRGLL